MLVHVGISGLSIPFFLFCSSFLFFSVPFFFCISFFSLHFFLFFPFTSKVREQLVNTIPNHVIHPMILVSTLSTFIEVPEGAFNYGIVLQGYISSAKTIKKKESGRAVFIMRNCAY